MISDLVGKPVPEPEPRKFPWLGILKHDCTRNNNYVGRVVLFINPRCGVVVHNPNNDADLGYTSDGWTISAFEELRGTVELSNS